MYEDGNCQRDFETNKCRYVWEGGHREDLSKTYKMIFMKFVLHQFQRPRLASVPVVPVTLHTEREPLFGRDFAVKFFGLF